MSTIPSLQKVSHVSSMPPLSSNADQDTTHDEKPVLEISDIKIRRGSLMPIENTDESETHDLTKRDTPKISCNQM